MAIDTTAKTLIEVKADTSQAQKAIRDLAETTAKGNAELKRQAEQSSLVSKKWEELGKSMVGLQINETFKRISESVKDATGGVLDLNGAFAGFQAAGIWGAAVGAVGVAVAKTANLMDGLGIEMDDLEKKAQAHARTFMPELTSEVWKEHDAIKAMNDRLAETPGAIARALGEFAKLYPILVKVREEIQTYDSAPASVNRGLRAGAKGLQDFIGDATTRFIGVSGWNPLKFKTGGNKSYDDVATGLGIDAMSRLYGSGQVGNFDVLADMQRRADEQSAASTSSMIRGSADFSAYNGFQTQLDAFNSGEGARRNASAYADYNSNKTTSFMEKTFGPVGQFDAYASAFQGFQSAVSAGYEALITGSEPVGQAFKKMAAQSLVATGAQLMGEGIKNEVYALGYLITGNFAQAAAAQTAALKAFAGAAAVGVIAAGLGAGGGNGARPASGGRAPNVAGGGSGPQRGPERVIVYGDSFAEDNPRSQQHKAEKIVRRALGNTAVEAR